MNTEPTLLTEDKVVTQLEDTRLEIEQFIQELNHQNTDPEKRYEKLKEDFGNSVKEIRDLLTQGAFSGEFTTSLQTTLLLIEDHLKNPQQNVSHQVRHFLDFIDGVLGKVTIALSEGGAVNERLEMIYDELQRYRLKFEVIKLKLALGKLKLMYTNKNLQYRLSQKIHMLGKIISESKQGTIDQWKHFRRMTSKIYSDISKLYT